MIDPILAARAAVEVVQVAGLAAGNFGPVPTEAGERPVLIETALRPEARFGEVEKKLLPQHPGERLERGQRLGESNVKRQRLGPA